MVDLTGFGLKDCLSLLDYDGNVLIAQDKIMTSLFTHTKRDIWDGSWDRVLKKNVLVLLINIVFLKNLVMMY